MENLTINNIAVDFNSKTVNGMPIPEDYTIQMKFQALEESWTQFNDLKGLRETFLNNALWQDGELEKARALTPQIEDLEVEIDCRTSELLYYVEGYWEDFSKEEEPEEDDWEDERWDYWEDSIEEDDSCLPSDSYREFFGDFEIVMTPVGFEEVEVVFDSPHSMGETGNHYSVQELRALGEKILSMCRFVQTDMGRMLTFTAHPTSVGRERIYKMILLRAGAKITNGRQFVGKREKKHERGESFSFVL